MLLSHKEGRRDGIGTRQQIRIGCSGWQYKHWSAAATSSAHQGDAFYPAELSPSRWFAHYALSFDTVEINNSFYRLPPPETFARWREQAPRHFLYAVKASRFLTHMKKLKDPVDPLLRFFTNARELGRHLGPVLYQLPPNFGLNLERFEIFLRALAPVARCARLTSTPHHVVEFRHPSWYDDRVYALLERYRVSMCLHDMQGSATGKIVIPPAPRAGRRSCVYVRFHFGTSKYGGRYEDRRLDDWADWLVERITEGRDVFAYFNNDSGGHAPRDAVRLRDRIQIRLQHAVAS
ncbi:MAG TPA: DUF72 domain-containing protein [Vicinamibacterales bacterium]|jgi:uncharacterized protein YecE (DUF72 family)|nr:DUF72 domain-containing protein [Vicinamibacterales bacterium]